MIYNTVHTYVEPPALGCYARFGAIIVKRCSFPLIWAAHISLDRMLGFGLKYPDTLQRRPSESDRHALEIANSPFGSLRQADERALSNRRPPGR